jgi:ABC-type phosphate transport system substrate-binding protein
MAGRRVAKVLGLVGLAAAALWVVVMAPPSRARAAGTTFKVVVNQVSLVTTMDRKLLGDVFLKKVTRWGSGEVIRPVDLRPDSPVRQAFSDEILRRSVQAVKNYWQQLVFSGRDVPPPEVDTDEQVINYIRRFGGAVGYVSAAAPVDGVKIVAVK